MTNFNISAIIEQYKLEPKSLAAQLFPENAYPMPALKRVIEGEALLNTDQISKLSHLTGIPIYDLFTGEKWKGVAPKDAEVMTLENGEFKASLNRKTWVTKLYHKNSIFHESVIMDGDSVPMSVYLSELDKIILNHK